MIALLINRRAERYPIYIFRRLARLYPLYLIALLLGIATTGYYDDVIGQSYFGMPAQDNTLVREQAFDVRFWGHLIAHLTMIHGAAPDSLLPLSALAFSGPLWSISLERQFYLLAPLLVWALDYRVRNRR